MVSEMPRKTEKIARLNDDFRKTLHGGKVLLTCGVAALPEPEVASILNLVREFNAFSAENDPYGQHDFGAIEHAEHKILFKIDYYDKDLRYGSEDPSDPVQTTRVLTIMFAHEY